MTAPADPTAAVDAVLRALCWPPPPDQPHPPDWPVTDWRTGLGDLIEQAILHKMLCLLADRLATTGLDRDLPPTISRFLASTLRANHYKTSIYRAETARIMAAIATVGLAAVALNGIAAESRLYGGTGARQFTDLDLLVAPEDTPAARTLLIEFGYYNNSPQARAFTRHLEDILVPRITIDLTSSLHHAASEDDLGEILSRRTWQPLPGHDQLLPVLAAPDALLHCLARLNQTAPTPPETGAPRWALCADALRLARACHNLPAAHPEPAPHLPRVAAAGWTRLRHIWPHLPPTPFSAPSADTTGVDLLVGTT